MVEAIQRQPSVDLELGPSSGSMASNFENNLANVEQADQQARRTMRRTRAREFVRQNSIRLQESEPWYASFDLSNARRGTTEVCGKLLRIFQQTWIFFLYIYLDNIQFENKLSEQRRLIALDAGFFAILLVVYIVLVTFVTIIAYVIGGAIHQKWLVMLVFAYAVGYTLTDLNDRFFVIYDEHYALMDQIESNPNSVERETESNFMIVSYYLCLYHPFVFKILLYVIPIIFCITFCVVFRQTRALYNNSIEMRSQRADSLLQKLAKLKKKGKDFENELGECSICLERLGEQLNEDLIVLPCSDLHVFHFDCLETWLQGGNTQCVLCRAEIDV